MLCCSSCSLHVQGHQLPTGPRCSILSNEALHASGLEPECTICLQPWASHPRGKHITKECKFCHQQALGDTAPDNLDPAEESDVQSRLACITQENHIIKPQLSQLTKLVWQLLLQTAQAVPQPADISNSSPVLPPDEVQSSGTSGATLSLPPPSWSQLREAALGHPPGNHWAVLLSPLGQPLAKVSGTLLPAVTAPVAPPDRPAPTPDMHTLASLGFPSQPQHPIPSARFWPPAANTHCKSASGTSPCFHQGKSVAQ